VPASIKLQQAYGDDLQVLFVECQGADIATAEAFAWRQKWMGTAAMWTTERPLDPEGSGLPAFALLDTEGKVLLKGNPLDKKKDIEEAIAAQVKKAKSAPEGTPAKLAKTWASFAKGNVGAAIAECDKLGAADASLSEAAKTLRTEMVARTQARIARGKWLLDNGYGAEASELLGALGKAVKGCADFDGALPGDAPDGKSLGAEAEAAKALAALQQKMVKDKPFEDANLKALEKLAETHPGTKAAARATHLLELAKIKLQ
jgi:hypothetical protein